MEIHLDCIPCFQRQALEAVRFVTSDPGLQEAVLREVMSELQKTDWRRSAPELAHMVHRVVREKTGEKDPYNTVKKEYNDLALGMYSELKRTVSQSPEQLLTAVRLAIAGNIIDFGVNSNFDLKTTIKECLEKEFGILDFPELAKGLEATDTLVYLVDNTGEIVFDRVLLETILDNYKIKKILLGVKGAPIINDATLEDAIYIGMDALPGIKFFDVGIGDPGTGMERNSKEFLETLKKGDMVISKGQGNYEALSETEGIFFLLMAKCPIIADDLAVEVGDIVLKKG